MVVDASALQRPVSDDAGDSSFPWILDVLEIQPFDFFKVIDSFIKADANLPSSVVKVSFRRLTSRRPRFSGVHEMTLA